MSMPAALIDILRAASTDFAAEPVKTQRRLASMAWKALEPRRRHRVYPDSFALFANEVRAIWGAPEAMYKALAGKHFLVMKGDSARGYALAFQLDQRLLDGLHAFLANPQPSDFIDVDGKTVPHFPQAIAPHRANSRARANEWQGCYPCHDVPVSEAGLQTLRLYATPLERQMIGVLVSAARTRKKPGTIPIRYVSQSSGRLFNIGMGLQRVPRAVRAAALVGCFDYDISNCHFAILHGLADQMGLLVPAIGHYLRHKTAVRQQIANEAGITPAQAKECLLMMIYGAPLSSSTMASLHRFVPVDAIPKLQASPTFVAMAVEVRMLRKKVIRAHQNTFGWVINHMGRRVLAAERKPAQLLAHVMQGYEAAALRAVVRRYQERVLLCMHDGWVMADRLDDLKGCESDILLATGLPLVVEETRLELPDIDARVRIEEVSCWNEISLEEQPLASGAQLIYESSSPLEGCPPARINVNAPRGFFLSERAAWNYRSAAE